MKNYGNEPKRLKNGEASGYEICGDSETLGFMLRVLYNRDCSELARRLIERFGSVHGVFKATHAELAGMEGMTERAAAFFAVLRAVFSQAVVRSVDYPIDRESALAMLSFALFLNDERRSEYCVSLDCDGTVIEAERLSDRNRVCEIIGKACRSGAEKIAWISNIPHGVAERPDSDRREEISSVIDAAGLLGIEFVDYFICTPDGFYSLRREVCGSDGFANIAFASDERYGKTAFIRSNTDTILEK